MPQPVADTPRADPLDGAASAIPPHPVLRAYYDDPESRQQAVDAIFDAAAVHYDRITALMSFGSGAWHRRDVLRRIGVQPGSRVLDVACGTGQIAASAQQIVGPSGRVLGVDPSAGMRHVAQSRRQVETRGGTADDLPVDDASFDFVIMGYALRHAADLIATFREFRRVLRPGGKVVILEITAPQRGIGRFALKVYLRHIVPPLSLLVSGSKPAYRMMTYYWDSIDQCVQPEVIVSAMSSARLCAPQRRITFGMLSEYIAHVD